MGLSEAYFENSDATYLRDCPECGSAVPENESEEYDQCVDCGEVFPGEQRVEEGDLVRLVEKKRERPEFPSGVCRVVDVSKQNRPVDTTGYEVTIDCGGTFGMSLLESVE